MRGDLRSPSPLLQAGNRALSERKSTLGILFLTVVVDLLGFGIVLPLLPLYAERFKASGAEIGLLFASFSIMQFLFAPFWGRLSDRFGRRPLIMLGLAGSAASYLLFALAKTYTLLLVSRVLAGFFGATIGTAQAYIADTTGREDRGKEMALIGAAFGVGFTVGPAIGGITFPMGESVPGFVAAGLSLLALLLAWAKLPEPERHVERRRGKPFDFAAVRHSFSAKAVPVILVLTFLSVFCFANFEGTLARLLKAEHGFDESDNGWMFAYVGFCLLIAQGFIVRRFMKRVGEQRFCVLGAVLLAAGLFGVGVELPPLAILPIPVLGFAMMSPSLASLLSLNTPPDMQGEVLGVGQSFSALARIFGPFLGNVIFDVSPQTPFWAAGGFAILAFVLALGLRRAPADT